MEKIGEKFSEMKYFIIFALSVLFFLDSCAPGYSNRKETAFNDAVPDKKWMFRDNGREKIVNTAKRFLGVKYRYGGTSPFGFDCSGFVMYVFKRNGYAMPREAEGQFRKGVRINIKKAKPGDLVFFHTRSRRISHVGIYMGGFKFIHSPSRGKRVSITNMKNPYWKRRYIGTVSMFPSNRTIKNYSKVYSLNQNSKEIN